MENKSGFYYDGDFYDEDVFYKKNPTDIIWWVATKQDGLWLFSFDKKEVFNMFLDYHKLTKEQKEIFDKENPFWERRFRRNRPLFTQRP